MPLSEATGELEDYLDSFWCLYHKPTKSLIDGLSWRQLRAIIPTLEKEAVKNWLVWREGEVEWSELSKRINKVLAAGASKLAIPPLAPELGNDEETHTKTKTRPALSSQKTSGGIDRRMTKRFNRTVDVTLEHGGKVYANRTKDISVMGIKLETEVPFETDEIFRVFLHFGNERLELHCQLNRNEMGLSRSRLRVLPGKNIEKLADYLTRG